MRDLRTPHLQVNAFRGSGESFFTPEEIRDAISLAEGISYLQLPKEAKGRGRVTKVEVVVTPTHRPDIRTKVIGSYDIKYRFKEGPSVSALYSADTLRSLLLEKELDILENKQ